MMRFVAVNSILGKGAFSPCVSTAHTVDVGIDVQIDEASALNLVGVLGFFQIFFPIVPGTNAERLQSFNAKGFSSRRAYRCNFKPADVAAISVILWVDVLCLVFRYRHLVLADEG